MSTPSHALSGIRRLFPWAVVLALPTLVQAHTGVGHASGFSAGAAHPLLGLDHLCAMIAVGLWAAQRGGRSLWVIPATFVSVMALGGVLGISGVHLAMVESGIIASVLILGLLIAAAVRLPVIASALVVGLFALFHGQAHGAEMPVASSGLFYGLGFLVVTALLHGSGIGLGLLTARSGTQRAVRYAGGAIAACGLVLCFV